jgi:predicted metal-binding protein
MECSIRDRFARREAGTHIFTMTLPVVAPRRASPILVCRKCLKRSCEGKEIRRELKHALKAQHPNKVKRPRLVSTSCFGICPKKAVILASGRSLQDGKYLLVADRQEVKNVLKSLLPSGMQAGPNGAPD